MINLQPPGVSSDENETCDFSRVCLSKSRRLTGTLPSPTTLRLLAVVLAVSGKKQLPSLRSLVLGADRGRSIRTDKRH